MVSLVLLVCLSCLSYSAAQTTCVGRDADIVFLLDSSGSICDNADVSTCANWDFMKSFITSIIDQLNIGSTSTRVGLVRFGNKAENIFFLNDYTTAAEITAAVTATAYVKFQNTNTSGAIYEALSQQFTAANGDSSDRDNILIVLTDGQATDGTATLTAAADIESEGIKTLVIGVTDNIDEEEIKAIAYNPSDTNSVLEDRDYWLSPTFDQLSDISENVISETCTVVTASPCTAAGSTDIVFLLDASGSICNNEDVSSCDNWDLMKSFITSIIDQLSIGDSGSRVGLIRFGNKAEHIFFLDTYSTKAEIVNAVTGTEYVKFQNTNTSGAIYEALGQQFISLNGDRSTSENILIVLTDGQATDAAATLTAAGEIQAEGLKTLVIGVTDSVNEEEIKAISNNPNNPEVENQDYWIQATFSDLNAIVNEVVNVACVTPATTSVPAVCVASYSDVVFVLDESGSICNDEQVQTCDNWVASKNFINSIIESLDIGPTQTRVGLVTFGSSASNEFFLNSFSSKAAVQAAVSGLAYTSWQTTATHLGINRALNEQFTTGNGARADATSIMIVLTDGKATDSEATRIAAETAETRNVKVLAIGVTDSADEAEVKMISSQPEVENEDYWISPTFEELGDVADSVASQATCTTPAPPATTPTPPPTTTTTTTTTTITPAPTTSATGCVTGQADLVIVLDQSGSICDDNLVDTCPNWVSSLNFINAIIQELNIGLVDTRVGLVLFGSSSSNEFFLRDYTNKASLQAAVSAIPYTPWQTTATDQGITRALNEQFIAANGARADADNIMLVITDGQATDAEATRTAADLASSRNVKVLAVGITDSVDEAEIRMIATGNVLNEDYWLSTSFEALDDIAAAVATQAACPTAAPTTTTATPAPTPVPTVEAFADGNPGKPYGVYVACPDKQDALCFVVPGNENSYVEGPAGDTGVQGLTGPRGPVGGPGPSGPPGARGPTGPQGDTGPRGVQGPRGERGSTGEIGSRGNQGQQGPDGVEGVVGSRGATGGTGFAGPAGATGMRGLPGATGLPGQTGLQGGPGAPGNRGAPGGRGQVGPDGFRGNTGATGSTGSRGNTGGTGAQGIQGARGLPGEDGQRGLPGLPGSSGLRGLSGPAGAQGAPGLAGRPGQTGVQGSDGPVGLPGRTGSPGPSGNRGAQGGQGPRGEQGFSGATGPTGRTGATGAIGVAGFDGFTGSPGPRGPKGPTGAQGNQGNRGPIGPSGSPGPFGATGRTGQQGLQGATGSRGADGVRGRIGATGLTGLTGFVGAKGEQGVAGAPGSPGGPGDRGADGERGSTGARGSPGSRGTTGATGATGPAGPRGITGASGSSGSAGVVGFKGERGPSGSPGATGSRGTRGETGATGGTGPAGPQGSPGATGSTGSQGVEGFAGFAGPAGAPGLSGPAGGIGDTGATGSNGVGGVQGATGQRGPAGGTGSSGERGVPGLQGATGPRGAPGVQGFQGDIGVRGDIGEIGATGLEGNQGATGLQGVNGAIGVVGLPGPIGPVGPQGPRGAPGGPIFYVNECMDNNGGCGQICIDTYDGYCCQCEPGYRLLPLEDYNCEVENIICRTTIEAGYQCQCNVEGRIIPLNGTHCFNEDECASSNGGCSHICTDSDGSYSCSCPTGLTLASDRHTCLDINECNNNNICNSGTCVNVYGSYRCITGAGISASPLVGEAPVASVSTGTTTTAVVVSVVAAVLGVMLTLVTTQGVRMYKRHTKNKRILREQNTNSQFRNIDEISVSSSEVNTPHAS